MSRHWMFEVHVKTPGETDSEEAAVEQFARIVQSMGTLLDQEGLEVTVATVERT